MYENYKVIALCISHISDTRHYEFISELYNHIRGTDYRLFIYQTKEYLYSDRFPAASVTVSLRVCFPFLSRSLSNL